ncbi:MAG: hypothetical protein ACLQGP_22305 [Isosphaeraceae bacterium]
MITIPACPTIARSIERFRNDFDKRYPERSGTRSLQAADSSVGGPPHATELRLQKLPPEIGVLLIVVGTAGVLLPGPVGSPFLVAGGLALWPSGFRKVERWFMKVAPRMYDTGIRQIEHFLSDLERRYPGSVYETTSSGPSSGA